MPSQKKRIVIIGATSAIAEHCARLWVKESPVELVLVGRDIIKTELVAKDLLVRSPESSISCEQANFVDPIKIRELVDGITKERPVDMVLIAHGALPDQEKCQTDLMLCQEGLVLNGVSPALFAEAFAGHMQTINSGTLAVIGSVAGDRGRRSNYVYGAAKGLVARYMQGLQHRLASTNVRIVLIKPGPTNTPMTAHLVQHSGKLANVEYVAEQIVRGVEQGKAVIYTPSKWLVIMMIIRHLPRFIFNKMNI